MTSPTPYPPGQGGLPPGLTPGGPPPAGQQPGSGWIPVGAGGPPAPPVVADGAGGGRGRRRPGLTVLGIVLVVGGIGAAVALFVAGSQRYSDGIEKLARGPANCVTTIDVGKDATYYFYVETKGEVADVRGNCPAVGESFDVGDDGDARLTLSDEDGESVRLRRSEGTTYSSGGYSGELVRTARLDSGRYQLAVEADEDVVVAVGRDVDDLKTNVVVPIIVGAAGVVLGIALLLLGRRRSPAAPAGGQPRPVAPMPGPTGPAAQPSAGWSGFQPPQPGQH